MSVDLAETVLPTNTSDRISAGYTAYIERKRAEGVEIRETAQGTRALNIISRLSHDPNIRTQEELQAALDIEMAKPPAARASFNNTAGGTVTPRREPEVRVADARAAGARADVPISVINADEAIRIDPAVLQAELAELARTLPQLNVETETQPELATTEGEEIVVTARRPASRDRREEQVRTANNSGLRDAPVSVVTADERPLVDPVRLQAELAELAASLPRIELPAAEEEELRLARADESTLTADALEQYANARVSSGDHTRLANVGGSVRDMRTSLAGDDESLYLLSHFDGRANAGFNMRTPRALATSNVMQIASGDSRERLRDIAVVATIESSLGVVPDRPGSNYRSPFQIGGAEVAAQFRKPEVQAAAARYGITPQFANSHRDHPLIGALASDGMLQDIRGGLRSNFGAPGTTFTDTQHLGLMYASYNQGQGAGIKLGQAVVAVREGRMDPNTPAWQAMGIPLSHAAGNSTYFFNRDGSAKTVNETMNAYMIATSTSAAVYHDRMNEHFPGNAVDMQRALSGLQTPQAQVVAASYAPPTGQHRPGGRR